MKLTVIGGGSSYTPELIEGVIRCRDTLPIDQVVLVDIAAGLEHAQINRDLARRMVRKAGLDLDIQCTLDRREGLRDAAFVISQIRVGGLDARGKDERIPLKYDVIGQETTGPGGCFKALRTIPVMLEICRDMEAVCPDAWLINFTNPSGIITEAILRHSQVKCIGLCNISINMHHDAAQRLGLPAADLDCRFIGLNHLSVMTRAIHKGTDRMKEILTLAGENIVKNIDALEDADRLAAKMGCLLSPYLQYFYTEKEMLAELKSQALGLEGTRAQQVQAVESELFRAYADPSLEDKPEALSKRGGARYSQAAMQLIDSIWNDRQDVQVVDTFNHGTIPFLPDDAVIETNCRIGRSGAVPLREDPVPQAIGGLIAQVKTYERLTIDAALSGDRTTLLLALLNNPLVHSAADANGILEELLQAHRAWLPRFFPAAT